MLAFYQFFFGESESSTVIALRRELAAKDAQLAAERAAYRLSLAASEKTAFFERMRIVSSQASKLSPTSGQRLEVAQQSDAELSAVLGVPLLGGAEDGAVAAAWARACATLRRTWVRVEPQLMRENIHLHPVMESLLAQALPPCMRLWHEADAVDDIPFDEMRPDFLVAHARDAKASLLGSIVLVEVKKGGPDAQGLSPVRKLPVPPHVQAVLRAGRARRSHP